VLDAQVRKRRSHFTVDVDVRVDAGAACGLFGISGSGKSTILSCIAGALTPDGGRITFGCRTLFPPPLPLNERPIGYLTQDANLFPHLRVADNVAYGLRNGVLAANASWLAELRDRLELDAIWHQPARAVSGGQARRVALARMLARKPELVLLDEPFSGLDRHLVRELLEALARWQRELRFTLLAVDHQAEVLERLCPRVVAIEDGRVVQDATWDELRTRPATSALARLLAPL
jgi:ABC-type sulfate/molybdate transport systems ATPase subunit